MFKDNINLQTDDQNRLDVETKNIIQNIELDCLVGTHLECLKISHYKHQTLIHNRGRKTNVLTGVNKSDSKNNIVQDSSETPNNYHSKVKSYELAKIPVFLWVLKLLLVGLIIGIILVLEFNSVLFSKISLHIESYFKFIDIIEGKIEGITTRIYHMLNLC